MSFFMLLAKTQTIARKGFILDKTKKKSERTVFQKTKGRIMRSLKLYACLALLTTVSLTADPSKNHVKYGLAPLKDHEVEHLENVVHKVTEVTPNELGLRRIQKHHEKHSIPLPPIDTEKEEFTTLQAQSHQALESIPKSAPLPTAVDNSKLPSFPPIGDQGQEGSCVAWGSTYYQATHELGLVHGYNNKTSNVHILSPKWTYNLVNGGADSGSSPATAYQLLSMNGAVSIHDYPYDLNYKAWDLNTQDWINALSSRMAPWTLIPGLGGSGPQNLTAIKQALNNGHVLTFATFIDSWMFTKIKTDPQNPRSPYTGQYAASWMNGQRGGHFMTIVGYNDNIWIDINGNGVVDPGERGAFLVANSWGTNWGNNGFIWISYDAFLAQSGVKNGPSHGRVAAGAYLNSCLISVTPKASNYSPRLIAEFTLSQAQRNQINIQTGISNTQQTHPTSLVSIPAFANEGGGFAFDGTSGNTPKSATFAVDLTDFIPTSPQTQRYYLVVGDNRVGNITTLSSFSLLDLTHQKKINSLLPLPQSYDHQTGSLYIDY